jgi:uncharacterized protein YijF (DUF1287 family)
VSTETKRDGGPSEKAVEAARNNFKQAMSQGLGRLTQATDAFDAAFRRAHDPALGLQRSVCLADVVEALRSQRIPDGTLDGKPLATSGVYADFIERRFGGQS